MLFLDIQTISVAFQFQAFIPLKLFEIKLQLLFMIDMTIKEIGKQKMFEVAKVFKKNQ